MKVIVLSYYFPPCNLTPSQRISSWATDLNREGIYPTIITRKWEREMKNAKDMAYPTSRGISYERHENFDVYYLPYEPSLRDKIFVKHGENKFVCLRKSLTLLELVGQNFSNAFIPYGNIYNKAVELIKADPSYKAVVISGSPFNLFRFGFLLNKKFGIKWVADYRDAWTTSQISSAEKNFLFKLISSFDKFSEKKWVNTASKITSVSEHIAKSIESITGVKGEVLHNGFSPEDFLQHIGKKKFNDFTVTYVGTLYNGQPIEIFLEAFKKFVDETKSAEVKLLLPGLAFFGDQTSRIKNQMKGYEKYFEISDRIPRDKMLEIEVKSHLLLHVAWKGYKGIVASKIYEYIGSGTKILVVPSDKDSVEQIITESKCGVVTNSVSETLAFLHLQYLNYKNEKIEMNDIHSADVTQFSRAGQTKKLMAILNSL